MINLASVTSLHFDKWQLAKWADIYLRYTPRAKHALLPPYQNRTDFEVFRKEKNLGGTADIFSAGKENVPRNTVSDLSENLAEKSFCSRQILIELGRNKQVCQIFFRKK